MTRRRRRAAGPSAAVAPREPPIAWPDHALAASGGEILATRILPLMGHNARDFARASAVCRGWRAACRAAAATLSVYRETTLQVDDGRPYYSPPPGAAGRGRFTMAWSPCSKFVAATACCPLRISIWRASTGALVNEWALDTPATAVSPGIEDIAQQTSVEAAFSRDGTRVLTLFNATNHFSVWSVPDGQLLAVNRGEFDGGCEYSCAAIGVPGSASDGLVAFGSQPATLDLWDVSPRPEGGASLRARTLAARGLVRPRRRGAWT